MPGSASGRRYVASMRKGGESSQKSTDENGNGKPEEAPPPASASSGGVVYRECMRNYAASSGGYAVDGCRQFTAKGDVGTPDAFKCAVCNCHRNFHRQEVLHSSCHCQRERDRS